LERLPAELGALTQLKKMKLGGCSALHMPPPHYVRQGTGAVLQFLRDLANGELQIINLSGCWSLEKLPAWVIGLTALREIDSECC
jgi:hypothetical protein